MKNKIYFFVIILIVLAGILYIIFNNKRENTSKVIINNNLIKIELAYSDKDKFKGLGGREFLEPNQGMLFVYEYENKPGFVMRDMNFPLDFIWIKNNRVVDISKNIPIEPNKRDLTVYYPKTNINYVLEVNAGYADKNNIRVGDLVDIIY